MNKVNRKIFFYSICLALILFEASLGKLSIQSSNNEGAFKQTLLDTAKLLSDQPLKSPMGAVIRSAIVPGWGQLYTKHYIKAGIASAINGAMIFQILKYQNQWKDTGNRDFQLKRNLFTWYFAATYFLTMVDSYVNAYLFKFNDAMKISQIIWLGEEACVAGVCFSFYW